MSLILFQLFHLLQLKFGSEEHIRDKEMPTNDKNVGQEVNAELVKETLDTETLVKETLVKETFFKEIPPTFQSSQGSPSSNHANAVGKLQVALRLQNIFHTSREATVRFHKFKISGGTRWDTVLPNYSASDEVEALYIQHVHKVSNVRHLFNKFITGSQPGAPLCTFLSSVLLVCHATWRALRKISGWVMLDDGHNFVPLPREKVLFTSPPRTTLSLETPNSYPGKEPLAISCSNGTAYLTNQRLVYLPADPNLQLKSFSAPIQNLQDTHVSAPFFGPNIWFGVLQPVTGGGIPPHHAYVKLKMTFKDGGAFDFSSTFERIKESLSQASELARETGRPIDLSNVELEQLPAYEEVASSPTNASAPSIQRPTPITPTAISRPAPRNDGVADGQRRRREQNFSEGLPPPNEPPPGYDEVQQNSIADNLEASIRRST
ncbi:hypothetical protein MMC07_001801 [Pseudocyphellaria aurata]|nr:hypothetical protein [Pseudocyphellaria aurata]